MADMIRAADLPDDTVVQVTAGPGTYHLLRTTVYIRNHPVPGSTQWRGTDGSHMWDGQIDTYFAEGRAVILRPATEKDTDQ